ncbi:D-threo-aldose 1-dehydrogenase [Trinickia symbiotica]|uniref:aldo/keto reductase n=1 Tax=Trinickia symbiotica TaxID=863227 RepID=UPI000D490012|nr:aldo/keto reductase [Trinickia symbiotica]PPK45980.1 D-threo-aldose 1-dehydrogenase [Trinickia symbiotica]
MESQIEAVQPTSGVTIPGPIGFGGAPLGNLFSPVSEELAAQTISAAWKSGVRYFDTAPFYGTGLSERRLGQILRELPRQEFVLSTKVGRILVPDDSVPSAQNGYVFGLPFRVEYDYSSDGAYRSIEDSLERLGMDRIDVVYIHDVAEDTHGPDWKTQYRTAMDGAARALSDLRAQGVIRSWGLGVNRVEPCIRALIDSDPDVFLLAGRYTLLDTSALDSLIPACEQRGAKLVVGGPYNSGLLAGGTTFEYSTAPVEMVEKAALIGARCAQFGVSLKAAALQFCSAPEAVCAVIAGARNPDEVCENVKEMSAQIPADLWRMLKADGLIPAHAPEPIR